MVDKGQRSQLTWCSRPEQRCLITRSTDLKMQLWVRWLNSCPWRRSILLRVVFRNASWARCRLQVRWRLCHWCSRGNQMRNQRKGSEVTGSLHWHQWCRGGTRPVLFCVWKKKKEPQSWKKLHVEGVDGRSCQHLQVKMTNLQRKHCEWQEERTSMLRYGSVVRPTMCLASMDTKTAFDEARPRNVAKIMESLHTHWWIVSALLREVAGLEGQAVFKCVESNFSFNRCLRQGNVEAPR